MSGFDAGPQRCICEQPAYIEAQRPVQGRALDLTVAIAGWLLALAVLRALERVMRRVRAGARWRRRARSLDLGHVPHAEQHAHRRRGDV